MTTGHRMGKALTLFTFSALTASDASSRNELCIVIEREQVAIQRNAESITNDERMNTSERFKNKIWNHSECNSPNRPARKIIKIIERTSVVGSVFFSVDFLIYLSWCSIVFAFFRGQRQRGNILKPIIGTGFVCYCQPKCQKCSQCFYLWWSFWCS